MGLSALFEDDRPELRLGTYRRMGIEHAILIVPFESLSRLAKEAAIRMAEEWGHSLAAVEVGRLEFEHSATPRDLFAQLWVSRLVEDSTHPIDAVYWVEQTDRWRKGDEADPRLDAFERAWRESNSLLPPSRPAGPKCKCDACRVRRNAARAR